MRRSLVLLFLILLALNTVHNSIAATLPEAFSQGAQFGRSGNAAARGRIDAGTAGSIVPGYTTSAPAASYFGGPGLGTPSVTTIANCAAAPQDPACKAINFSQTNPAQRPSYTITPDNPLLTRSRTITADPQAIAGNIAGTYSGCTVQTVTRPDIFETLTCHQYRTIQNATCDKVLVVTPFITPGCSPGQFLTRVTADPCPGCIDYLAYDFTCGSNNYLMHVFTIAKASGEIYMDLGSQYVPGTLNTEIGQTPGPSQIDGFFCYQTYYSQTCSGANCSIGAWFSNPCQGTSYYGVSTFAMPTTVAFTDSWDNQCAALEARAQ